MKYLKDLSDSFLDQVVKRDAMMKYNAQKGTVSNGKRVDLNGNEIKFKLTFEEWFQVWIDSGKWEQRGTKRGQYCMSRYNDLGDYEIGNVFIQLHSENILEFRKIAKQSGRPVGRPKSDNPKTPAERTREWRAKQKLKQGLQ
ncbi:hypothetical protein ACAX43_12415 [Paraburkholderia sp. IW21]|uniref:hypothetical protein n=1 Tax=Paraburkholderia sp. IW21 TaxID=3242488 RepID=UPI003522B41A